MNDILDDINYSNESNQSLTERVDEILEHGFDFDAGEIFREAFEIFKNHASNFIGFTLLLGGINSLSSIIGITIGEGVVSGSLNIGAGIISIPLGVGMALVARKIRHKEHYEFNNFFDGFNYFGPLVIAGVLVGLAVLFGFVFLIVPGIYLAVALSWTDMMVAFQKVDAVEAISISRKVISRQWFSVLGFYLICILIVIAGALALGVGLLVAIPVVSIAQYILYEKVIGTNLRKSIGSPKMG